MWIWLKEFKIYLIKHSLQYYSASGISFSLTSFLFLEQGQSEEGKVEREQGYSVQPLKVEMTAHIKPAL